VRSRKSFLLTQIPSALLLNGVGTLRTESPIQLNQGNQTQNRAQQHDATADLSASVVQQPTAARAASSGGTYIHNQYKQSRLLGDFPTWLEAIATLLLVIFARRQMRFFRRSTDATEKAAEATRRAVKGGFLKDGTGRGCKAAPN
jgi:hypothetical protein